MHGAVRAAAGMDRMRGASAAAPHEARGPPMRAQRRTLLECLPRRTVFRVLAFLPLRDITSLLCADRRLRPFAHAPSFAPWRRQFAEMCAVEQAYQAEGIGADAAFVRMYEDAVRTLGLDAPPTQLHEVLAAVVSTPSRATLPPADTAHAFFVPWVLGRVTAHDAFASMDVAHATELLSLARVFFTVARLTRALAPQTPSSSQYPQMFHVLDADCAAALDAFFAPPRAAAPAPGALTAEQAAFVEHPIRRNDLVQVQAFAGVRRRATH